MCPGHFDVSWEEWNPIDISKCQDDLERKKLSMQSPLDSHKSPQNYFLWHSYNYLCTDNREALLPLIVRLNLFMIVDLSPPKTPSRSTLTWYIPSSDGERLCKMSPMSYLWSPKWFTDTRLPLEQGFLPKLARLLQTYTVSAFPFARSFLKNISLTFCSCLQGPLCLNSRLPSNSMLPSVIPSSCVTALHCMLSLSSGQVL